MRSYSQAQKATNAIRNALWKQDNRERVNAYARVDQSMRYAQRRQALNWYKTTQKCADCGEDDPVILQFDHLPGCKKLFGIGQRCGARSLSALWAEVQKCDVVCANCHIKREFSRGV